MELVRVAIDFLIFKNGPCPSIDARKSVAQILHEQFPEVDQETWCKKLTQRIKNLNRKRAGDDKGHMIDFPSTADERNGKTEYLDYEDIDEENDNAILIDDDETGSEKFDDYETYDVWALNGVTRTR